MPHLNITIKEKKYLKEVERLREKIQNNEIEAVKVPERFHKEKDFTCFFCLQKIEGDMRILTETKNIRGYKTETRYALDEICYNLSKNFGYTLIPHFVFNRLEVYLN